ncbi:peptidoglycan/LPS O-acetylase OafA/YrhL [Microbacteriaceae bacterium SG_E_30_P1]|uniref:Peptidoglycan/LPS O-acetylase OafA/YrhL n=1 Tax=Antiquaquibacter oligotrophicus TaxID=2880260 RepID=A0ABT6KPX9_9MICO|nr:acyltransferase [Antiquaquibacter oligotrophicus]MDH6182040.1 peptidoglycan/LPS O-acetylase OafA/YrhL [Antiquaquibacter oligotrophicus]UDF12292.1 acyltransferase [Antiquaquibacter oligotrophicus]
MKVTVASAFNPRANSIGFVRWLMAFMVIFSHAGPLAGFYGGKDLGTQFSTEQSVGGVAVAGFFFLSGFLITQSRLGKSSTARFFWRRVVRIMPAFWLTLIVTAFVLAPIAWMREAGSINGYFTAPVDSPLTYFVNNMFLVMNQPSIAEMGTTIPFYTMHGGFEWNGSAWTLGFEFAAYILVGILGMIGALRNRIVATAVALFIIFMATLQWLYISLEQAGPTFTDYRVLLLLAPFAFGILFALWGEKIPLDDRLAIAAITVAAYTYVRGGWLVVGQYLFLYFLMWFAIRVTLLKRWERFGDFSYGIYIIAWPLMQFAAYFNLQAYGWLVYHAVIVVGCHIYAFLSWHLIEKPAMSLKNWTPRWLAWTMRKIDPLFEPGRRLLARINFPTGTAPSEIPSLPLRQGPGGTS